MTNEERLKHIKERLTAVFNPEELTVTDDSHLHRGHPGAKEGKGYFSIAIRTKAFQGKTLIECHRLIYAALEDLMKTEVHALQIHAVH